MESAWVKQVKGENFFVNLSVDRQNLRKSGGA